MRVCKREPRYRDRRGDDDECRDGAEHRADRKHRRKEEQRQIAAPTISAPGAQSGRVRNSPERI